MKVGDKVRIKKDYHPKLLKGEIGEITFIDDFSDEFQAKFDDSYATFITSNFEEWLELFAMEKKVVCPVVLVAWYKACEPYLKG